MTSEEAQDLLDRYQQGRCTPSEVAVLQDWYDRLIEESVVHLDAEEKTRYRLRMLAQINAGMDLQEEKSRRLWPVAAGAAVIWKIAAAIAVITLGTWLYYTTLSSRVSRDVNRNAIQNALNDIAPGKNTATLTLVNGTIIKLDTNKSSVVVTDSIKTMTMLTASTPRGGTYQITLPDGTRVWLNADTKISFPSQFFGRERKVLLTGGEAYFEVSKNKRMPFIVQTKDQKVTVLGTHFNVNSYGDEHGGTVTSLLEGSVELTNAVEARVLKPGERGVGTVKGIMLLKGDAADAIAWKNGEFIFKEEPLEDIMHEVARWYNIEVVYEDQIDERFTGTVSRSKNISQVLYMLERAKGVHFKIEGRKVTVTK